jgi:ABC-type dipeptide/oligopeptide/nickel transport system permease component
MPPILRFLLYRIISIPITLLIITMSLYGFVMLTPPQVRVTLYYPSGLNLDRMTSEQISRMNASLIKKYHLDDPYPIQYSIWAVNLLKGDWGWSPVHHEKVLPALLRRSPVTAEIAIYSILFFIPLGLISGVRAGSKKNSPIDTRFRFGAFLAISMPPFVMALVMLSIFYVGLHWFPPQRLSIPSTLFVNSDQFQKFTGFMTIDGFLNHRSDISIEAFKHLVLPVLTISLCYWGIIGRVTRASVIEEQLKEHVIAARARGISERSLVWKHIFRNAMTPALTSSVLSAAALFTSVFIVEIIFDLKGVSSLVLDFSIPTPDAPMLLGFAVYSVLVVLLLMLFLDLILAASDPRIREGVLVE